MKPSKVRPDIPSPMSLNNPRGMSLIEALIVGAIFSIISLATASIFLTQQKAFKNIENKSNFLSLSRDMDLILQSQSLCVSAFRENATQLLTYNPPANLATPFSVPVPAIYSGDQLLASVGVPADNPGFRITQMELRRVTGAPISLTNFVHPVTGTVTPVRRHVAEFRVEAQRMGGTLDGQPLQKRGLIYIFSNSSSNEVVSCQLSSSVRLKRAIAKRVGLTAENRTCLQPVENERFMANPGCPDADADGFCDGTDLLTQIANPLIADGTFTAADYAFKSTSEIGAAGQEGRCGVTVITNTSDEDSSLIFRVRNAPTGATLPYLYDGLGCSTVNGWYLSGCFSSNFGFGDSDTVMAVDPSGEYCMTNDFTQPHVRRLKFPWGMKQSGVSVVCTKFE